MTAFVLTAGRIVVRRLINDWLMLTVLTVTVMAAMVQLAAAPMYNAAVTVGAMQRILADAPAADTTIVVDSRTAPATYAEINAAVTQAAEAASATTGASVTRRLESASSYDLVTHADDESSVVASLTALVGVEDEATLIDGAWPSGPGEGDDGDNDGGAGLDVAISNRGADALGVGVGDEVVLNDRRTDQDFTVRVGGVFRIDEPTAAFWLDDALLTAGVSQTRTTRTVGPFVVHPSVLFGESTIIEPPRLVATWLIEPRLDRLTVDDVDDLRRSLSRLPDQLGRLSGELSPEASSATSELDVTSSLPELLLDTSRSLAVTRSGLYAVVAQLALLAAMALAIGAGLLIETRRRETALLEARGIGRRQLIAFAVLEAILLVVPVAVLAPWVAAGLLRMLGRFGPLAVIDLAVDAPVNNEAIVTVAVASVFVIVLLAWPSIRATTSITNPLGHHRRQRVRQLTQSLGVDAALLVLTVVAFWQLRAISSTPIARLADRFSVDPVLVVTPALGLLTGAVLSLRIVPLMARLGERVATASRSVVGALTGWQLARRPGGQARAAFLLVMAVSIGFFAASYAATWDGSQADQADFQVGADLRVQPNRRTNDSITDLHLGATHEALDQVDASMPVQRITGPLPGSDRPGAFLLVDATKAAEVASLRLDGSPDFANLMDELATARPRLPALEVPGEPRRLEFTFDTVEVLIEADDPRIPEGLIEDLLPPGEDVSPDEEAPDEPAPDDEEAPPDEGEDASTNDDASTNEDASASEDPPTLDPEFLPEAFLGQADVVIQDGDGLLHRLPLGPLSPNAGPQVLAIDLTESAAGDTTLRPAYPLSIVELQIRVSAPLFLSRDVTVGLVGLNAVAPTGEAAAVALVPPGDQTWTPSTVTQGRSTGQPTITLSATDGAVSLDLETAASDPFSTTQVLFGARPGRWSLPEAFPVVVSRRWLNESRTDIGDGVTLETIRSLSNEAKVTGAIDVFPTVDPVSQQVMLADLPTIQIIDHELGRPIRTADEYWLSVDDSGTSAVAALLAATPYESVEVQGRQRRYVSLTTDPAALATIGAFTIGFVVASVFAVLVFVAVTAVSARERRSEFTLLRAFGLGPRQFVGWMTTEQLAMVATSVVLGAVVGFGLSASVLPLISIGQQGAPAVPPADPRYPWMTITVVVLAPLTALAIAIVATALRRERDSLGNQLREGVT